MPFHESADQTCREHHKAHGEHDRNDHDRDLVRHPDCSDDRIERKN
jgi:hypothetical protein